MYLKGGCIIFLVLFISYRTNGQLFNADEVRNSTKFSLDFYRNYLNASENAICAPISFRIILSIVYQSALYNSSGATELRNVLYLNENRRNSRVSQMSVLKILLQNPSLILSNKIYVTDKYQLREKFKTRIAKYNSEIESINFNEKFETATKINNWVSNKTRGQITSLMTPESITNDLMVLLVNTLYFKGKWDQPFEQDLIYKSFYGYDRTYDKTAFMKQKEVDLGYARVESIKSEVIEMYYDIDTNNRFWLILPNEGSNITEVANLLTPDTISEVRTSFIDGPVDIEMPTFTIENEIDGNTYMKKMGLDSVFSGNEFHMVKNGPPLSISDMKQKTKIIVNTDGTEAAVASCKFIK